MNTTGNEYAVENVFADDDIAAGRVGPFTVVCIAGVLTAAHVDQLDVIFEADRVRWRSSHVNLVFLRDRAPLPDDEVRRRVAAVFSRADAPSISCAIIDGDGFWAAAARGVFAGLSFLSRRSPHPMRSLDEALAYAQKRLPASAFELRPYAPALLAFRDRSFARCPARRR
jgi:hypothetical protein